MEKLTEEAKEVLRWIARGEQIWPLGRTESELHGVVSTPGSIVVLKPGHTITFEPTTIDLLRDEGLIEAEGDELPIEMRLTQKGREVAKELGVASPKDLPPFVPTPKR